MAERMSQRNEPSNQYDMNPKENDEPGDETIAQEEKIMIDQSLLIDLELLSINFNSIIGQGAHSFVYRGQYKEMEVAVKIIQPDQASSVSPECKHRFLREVMMLSRVKHPNLVKFIGASIEPSLLIVMELMGGGSLRNYLQKLQKISPPGCPDLERSIRFALDISQAMEVVHANGIIHRDLKPGNLLLTEDYMKLKVADFGLAREGEEMMTAEVGTYKWMAPELYNTKDLKRGQKTHYDRKVDVYSFAIVFWELLTNCTPFNGMPMMQAAYSVASENRRPSVDKLPEDLVPFIQSCWASDPAMRPEFTEITSTLLDYLHNTLGLDQTTEQPEQEEDVATEQPEQEEDATTHEQQQIHGQEARVSRTCRVTMNKSVEVVYVRKSSSSWRRSSSNPNSSSCFGKCSLG